MEALRRVSSSEAISGVKLTVRAWCYLALPHLCHDPLPHSESAFALSRRAPTATFHDSKHHIVHVHFDATRSWLLTSGTDKVIKVRCHLIKKLSAFGLNGDRQENQELRGYPWQ